MAKIIHYGPNYVNGPDNVLLINGGRVFLQSRDINVFPCSRRGQAGEDPLAEGSPISYYDPEARLNTERTNRLHTAINGFKDSFIITDQKEFESGSPLVFVLAGYYLEAKNFNPNNIATALKDEGEGEATVLYAYLRLTASVEISSGYSTEILARQSDSEHDERYLDVSYRDEVGADKTGDFFMGVSFVKSLDDSHDSTEFTLPLFKKNGTSWELVQTSLLPKIDHGETEDSISSIKISGDFTVEHLKDGGSKQTSFSVTKDKTSLGSAQIKELTVDNKLVVGTDGDAATGTITAKKLVNTPTLDVKTIKNTESGASVSIDDSLSVTGEATAKKLIIPSNIDENGTEKGEVKTPQLRVNRITSDGNEITVDGKKLIVNKSLEMLAKDGKSAEATIAKAVIGDLNVKTGLNDSTGKITATEITADKITQNGTTIPTISLRETNGVYQLQITLDASKTQN
jgi:hypothetical protein